MKNLTRFFQRGLTGVEILVMIVIAIIVLLLLIAILDFFRGSSYQSTTLSPMSSQIPVGGSQAYTVTVKLDGPAGPSTLQEVLYAFSGSMPAGDTYDIDLVEADTWWDDILHEDQELVIPWGQSEANIVLDVDCVTTEEIKGSGPLSDKEPSHQIRAEAGLALLLRQSDLATLTCVEGEPENDDGSSSGALQCEGRDCSHDVVESFPVPLPCPEPCSLPAERSDVNLGVSLVRDGAFAAAAKKCGEDCRCAPASHNTRIEGCRIQGEQCLVGVSVEIQGVCRPR